MKWLVRLFILTALVPVAACKSNNSGGCDTGSGTGLAASDWPKFHKDLGNTGHIAATVTGSAAEQWVFPPRDQPALDSTLTSPVITTDGKIVVVSRRLDFPTTFHVYMIDPATGTEATGFDISLTTTAGVSQGSAPVISETRIGILFADGVLREFDFDGAFFGSFPLNGAATSSPTIDREGTVYAGTTIGSYVSLCAGGGGRFALPVGPTESSAVLHVGDPTTVKDDFTIIGTNDGKVRAISVIGEALWTFTANAAVQASLVYDEPTYSSMPPVDQNYVVYGVDTSGRVFAVRALAKNDKGDLVADGRGCRNLTAVLPTSVIASPAFANNKLYIVDTDGVLHALAAEAACSTAGDSTTPSDLIERWAYPSGAPVSSSPAVATAPDGNPVVVFGADDGTVHAVVDHGSSGDELWTLCTPEHGALGRSSAAINSQGTVYVSTSAGRLYAIGATQADAPTPCSTPTATRTAVLTAAPTASSQPTATTQSALTPTATLQPTNAASASPTSNPSPSPSPTTSPGV